MTMLNEAQHRETERLAITWHPVILTGPYLKRMRCRLLLDGDGRIIDCDRIHCAFSGSARFDEWFKALYHPVFLEGRAHWRFAEHQPAAQTADMAD